MSYCISWAWSGLGWNGLEISHEQRHSRMVKTFLHPILMYPIPERSKLLDINSNRAVMALFASAALCVRFFLSIHSPLYLIFLWDVGGLLECHVVSYRSVSRCHLLSIQCTALRGLPSTLQATASIVGGKHPAGESWMREVIEAFSAHPMQQCIAVNLQTVLMDVVCLGFCLSVE